MNDGYSQQIRDGWSGRAHGHVDVEVSEWYATIDESWPRQDRRCINLQPHGDDMFTPHFSIGLMGSTEDLKQLAGQIIDQCREDAGDPFRPSRSVGGE